MKITVIFLALILSSCTAQISFMESGGQRAETNEMFKKVDSALGILHSRISALEEKKEK